MKKIIFGCILFGYGMVLFASGRAPLNAAENPFYLVKDGQPTSVIIEEDQQNPVVKMAVDELQYHLHRASGARIPTISPAQAEKLPASTVRIHIGNGVYSRSQGIDTDRLPVDTYLVQTAGNCLLFAGHDSKVTHRANAVGEWNAATMWAVDHYLDTQLGVRWLWPGEAGTYVPARKTIPLPELNVQTRPVLEERIFSLLGFLRRPAENEARLLNDAEYEKLKQDALTWMRRFQMGNRSALSFGHSFGNWWKRYHEKDPDLFAVPPAGVKQKMPFPQANRVKLNLSNEKVDRIIIREWQAKGAPDNWNVSPNDGQGFDTSDGSLAMDHPPNQNLLDIWNAKANLTARYVKFWNRLTTKMRRINPRVILSTYAYSAYRFPPPDGLRLKPGIAIQLVPATYEDYDHWNRWKTSGAHSISLRPNWWYSGSPAPAIPLHRQGAFFQFAQKNKMQGFYFDALQGYWSTMGPLYYVMGRLAVHPEMSVDQAIDEYCSAFGKASPAIKEYLAYWENFTQQAAYPASGIKNGLYEQTVNKYQLRQSPTWGSWQVLPYIDTDAVIDPADAILRRATKLAQKDDVDVMKRIQFLRNGLGHLKLTRDVIALGSQPSLSPEQWRKFVTLSEELQQMRHRLTLEGAIWGEEINSTEALRHVPTLPERVPAKGVLSDLLKKFPHYKVQNLDTDWRFYPDPQRVLLPSVMAKLQFNDNSWKTLDATGWWQDQGFEHYYGLAWYRKVFTATSFKSSQQILYFGAVDGDATVYLNGQKVGDHLLGKSFEGWDQPFYFDVTSLLQPERNVLVLQVSKNSTSYKSGINQGVSLILGSQDSDEEW